MKLKDSVNSFTYYILLSTKLIHHVRGAMGIVLLVTS